MKYLPLILLSCFLLISCDDPIEEIVDTPEMEIDSSLLQLVWETSFDSPEYFATDLYSLNGYLFCSVGKALTNDWWIFKISPVTGELVKSVATPESHRITIVDGVIHAHSSGHHGTYDDELNMTYELNTNFFPRMSAHDGMIFRPKGSPNDSFSQLEMNDNTISQNWRLVQEVKKSDHFIHALESPSVAYNEIGDTILYYQDRQYGFDADGAYEQKVDFYAFNLTKQSMEWERLSLDPYGSANVNSKPIIDGDRIFFLGLVSAFCLNRITGETIWQKDWVGGEGFHGTNYVFENNILYTRGSTGTVRFIDGDTGDVIFQEDNGASTQMIYADEDYFMNNGFDFQVHDARTGELLFRDEENDPKDNFFYDKENMRIYVTGYGKLYCFEIPH